jgi:serine protease Do
MSRQIALLLILSLTSYAKPIKDIVKGAADSVVQIKVVYPVRNLPSGWQKLYESLPERFYRISKDYCYPYKFLNWEYHLPDLNEEESAKGLPPRVVYQFWNHSLNDLRTEYLLRLRFFQTVELLDKGCGFIVGKEGYILTCNHNIAKAVAVLVEIGTETYEARILKRAEDADLALLKIDGIETFPLTLSKREPETGEDAIIIGNLPGLPKSCASGIIGSVKESSIQINIAVNPGNSGGPLFNRDGEVIGVVTAKATKIGEQVAEGIGFAVPIKKAEGLLSIMEAEPVLGVELTKDLTVLSIEEDSPADKAGVIEGDRISFVVRKPAFEVIVREGGALSFQWKPIWLKSVADLEREMKEVGAGGLLSLGIERRGEKRVFHLILDWRR